MGFDLWPMAYGLWVSAYGLWASAYGLWLMAYGLRSMACGLRAAASRVKFVIDDRKFFADRKLFEGLQYFDEIVAQILSRNSRIVLAYLDENDATLLFDAARRAEATNRLIWIGPEGWGSKIIAKVKFWREPANWY